MRSPYVHVINGIDFTVIRKVISILGSMQHVLLWKERPVAQLGWDERPAVSTQCQVLKKTCGNFAGTFAHVWNALSPVFIIPP